jgi:hypothetical protein
MPLWFRAVLWSNDEFGKDLKETEGDAEPLLTLLSHTTEISVQSKKNE